MYSLEINFISNRPSLLACADENFRLIYKTALCAARSETIPDMYDLSIKKDGKIIYYIGKLIGDMKIHRISDDKRFFY